MSPLERARTAEVFALEQALDADAWDVAGDAWEEVDRRASAVVCRGRAKRIREIADASKPLVFNYGPDLVGGVDHVELKNRLGLVYPITPWVGT